ncbi:rod-binding protein [Baekduia sp. Peel2402]|uniref:rod-binding protein n=1 Tax=Baekduia sp. Peel2402 TaxID=3458296 RepID=UPI00403E8712
MSTLPPIDNSTLPADIRSGSTEDKNTYKAALQFERQLVEQLTQSMADTAKGSDDESASPATQQYKQMLPGVMADAVVGSGGLGLARTIAANLKNQGATS